VGVQPGIPSTRRKKGAVGFVAADLDHFMKKSDPFFMNEKYFMKSHTVTV
jgi:hypothetical protein